MNASLRAWCHSAAVGPSSTVGSGLKIGCQDWIVYIHIGCQIKEMLLVNGDSPIAELFGAAG